MPRFCLQIFGNVRVPEFLQIGGYVSKLWAPSKRAFAG